MPHLHSAPFLPFKRLERSPKSGPPATDCSKRRVLAFAIFVNEDVWKSAIKVSPLAMSPVMMERPHSSGAN
jgi:hypothetical protein